MNGQRGSALVVAVLAAALILIVGLGAISFVDGSQRRSGDAKMKETAFNVGEAILNEEALLLGQTWPSTAALAMPSTCSAAVAKCPNPASVLSAVSSTTGAATIQWTTSVRDNLGTAVSYYDRTVTEATMCGALRPCTWDSNGDGAMWIRADATVGGHTRSIVALVRQGEARVAFPRNVIIAGKFTTNNNGNKTIVDEKGCEIKHLPAADCNATDPAPVAVRCTTTTPATTSDACLGYRDVQLSPNVYSQGFSGNVLSPSQLAQMRTYARQRGSYYTSCPSGTALAGSMVFIENASCSYTGGTINSSTAPGVLVVNNGTLSLGGNMVFYGVIYGANNLPAPQDAGAIITLSGTSLVYGAIFVEGNGGVVTGASGLNVMFDSNALSFVLAGAPNVVQNSFRELTRSQ